MQCLWLSGARAIALPRLVALPLEIHWQTQGRCIAEAWLCRDLQLFLTPLCPHVFLNLSILLYLGILPTHQLHFVIW